MSDAPPSVTQNGATQVEEAPGHKVRYETSLMAGEGERGRTLLSLLIIFLRCSTGLHR